MIGYSFLPQGYPYVPGAHEQAFAGNSTYHQSLATVLPQYKDNVSVSSLLQSAGVASGYEAFGSSITIPGSFATNPAPSAAGTSIRYNDLIGSQYKNNNQLLSLQQHENLAMWLHGTANRTMSAVPASTYYSLQRQSRQPGGFQQVQPQPSENYAGLGYQNFYHSQTGLSVDHQQQHHHHHPRDGSLSGSQGQPKQSQQKMAKQPLIWGPPGCQGPVMSLKGGQSIISPLE